MTTQNIRAAAMSELAKFATGRGAPFKEYAESVPVLDTLSDVLLMKRGIAIVLAEARDPEKLAWFEKGFLGKNEFDAVSGNTESRDLTKTGQTPEQWRERTLMVALQDRDFLAGLVQDLIEGKNTIKDKVKAVYSEEVQKEFTTLKEKEKAENEKWNTLIELGFTGFEEKTDKENKVTIHCSIGADKVSEAVKGLPAIGYTFQSSKMIGDPVKGFSINVVLSKDEITGESK